MSEFSRETLLNIIETDHVQCGEASALARMALAAMDSEPVAWVSQSNLDALSRGHDALVKSTDNVVQPVPLYRHAQPAPVVMEIDRQAIADKVYGKCCRMPGATFYNAAEFAIDEVEACRAAMLSAAPHDTHTLNSVQSVVTVPGKWIPVSERIPETDGNYWGWWSESKRQGPVWFIKSELQAQFQSHEITHWMPLPSAPQEEKP